MGEAGGDGSLSTDNHNKIQPTIIQRFPENRTDKRWESMQIQDNTAKFLKIMIIIETVLETKSIIFYQLRGSHSFPYVSQVA